MTQYEELVERVSDLMTNSDRTVKERAKEIVATVTFANKTGLRVEDVVAVIGSISAGRRRLT